MVRIGVGAMGGLVRVPGLRAGVSESYEGASRGASKSSRVRTARAERLRRAVERVSWEWCRNRYSEEDLLSRQYRYRFVERVRNCSSLRVMAGL